MDLELLLAQWSGTLPPGFVRPAILRTDLPNLPRLRNARYVFAPAPREPVANPAVVLVDLEVQRSRVVEHHLHIEVEQVRHPKLKPFLQRLLVRLEKVHWRLPG